MPLRMFCSMRAFNSCRPSGDSRSFIIPFVGSYMARPAVIPRIRWATSPNVVTSSARAPSARRTVPIEADNVPSIKLRANATPRLPPVLTSCVSKEDKIELYQYSFILAPNVASSLEPPSLIIFSNARASMSG